MFFTLWYNKKRASVRKADANRYTYSTRPERDKYKSAGYIN